MSQDDHNSTAYPGYKADEQWREQLDDTQYQVTRHAATERAFTGKYWDCHEAGLYRCAGCKAELFQSTDKFDSGCGWPSFTKPLEDEHVVELRDTTHGMIRTEVRSKHGDSHLGHVFPDGPRETGGLRYCINSASLRFIPVSQLEAEGFGQYRGLFEVAKK